MEDKIDYRIVELSQYPYDIEVEALVVTNGKLVKGQGIEVKKVYSFLNTEKVRGSSKALVELAKDRNVKYIALYDVITKKY